MAESPAEKLVAEILAALPGVFDDQVSLGRVCAAYTAISGKSATEALQVLAQGPYQLTEATLREAFYIVDEENPDDRPGVASQLNRILDKVQEFYCIEAPTA